MRRYCAFGAGSAFVVLGALMFILFWNDGTLRNVAILVSLFGIFLVRKSGFHEIDSTSSTDVPGLVLVFVLLLSVALAVAVIGPIFGALAHANPFKMAIALTTLGVIAVLAITYVIIRRR